ncbi:MAG: S24/S26 family peptidase [Bacteroidales bacterium]|nr:S24/S26 family peptidase [Bacteroidales bacterium]
MDERPSAVDMKVMEPETYFAMVKELLSEGKDVEMTPKGNSMLPFIKGGRDSVVLTMPPKDLEVGDIVLAKVGSRFVMHRVFAIEGEKLTLMGDGNIRGKEHCASDDVIAIVSEIHKENGKKVIPGKAVFWRWIRPLRIFILAIYKRVIL